MFRRSLIALAARHESLLFYGSDEFSVELLRAIVASGVAKNIVAVSTPGPHVRAHALPSPLSTFAGKAGLPCTIVPADGPEWHSWKPPAPPSVHDVAVVASFGRKLMPEMLSHAKTSLNVHPSLLPKYAGASPLQHALLNGDSSTGVTIQEVHPSKFDAGRIYASSSIEIPPNTDYFKLKELAAHQAAPLLVSVLADLEGHAARATVQTGARTLARKITVYDSFVDWESSSDRILRMERAIGHQFAIRSELPGHGALHLWSLTPTDPQTVERIVTKGGAANAHPGTLIVWNYGLHAKCSDGWITLGEVQAPTTRRLPGKAVINGLRLGRGIVGSFLPPPPRPTK